MLNQEFNLYLGSGGVRGFAHIGVIKAIEELKIKPKRIIGVSAGSIVGSMYVNGMDYKDIKQWAYDTDFSKLLTRKKLDIILDSIKTLRISPIFDGYNLANHLVNDLGIKLKDNLYICVTNYSSNPVNLEYYNKNLLEAHNEISLNNLKFVDLLASTISIPGLFLPVELNEQDYVDGGVKKGNCPIDLFKDGINIAVQIGYTGKPRQKDLGIIENLIGVAEVGQATMFDYQLEISETEIVIIPNTQNLFATDFKLSNDIIKKLIGSGYEATIKAFDRYNKGVNNG